MRTTRADRRALAKLTATVGEPGLAVVSQRPGLLADVDQHAAGIRETLDGDLRPMTKRILIHYAEGIRDAAARNGWRAPSVIDWSRPDWVLTRLLAVCLLLAKATD